MNSKITPEIQQSGENNEVLSIDTIKQEFLTIMDDFIWALKQSILVDPNRENVDIVNDIFHPIAVKGDLTFNDFSRIFQKDLRTSGEVNNEILNEINSFVSEHSEFFKWWYIFKRIFHKWNNEYMWWDFENNVQRLVKVITHELWLKKYNFINKWHPDTKKFYKEKLFCLEKLRRLDEIDLNIPGYIVFIIFRDILNEQENIWDFLMYASTIQNSFLIKDTALWERIDDFFLKYSTVDSTVDKVSEAVSNIRWSWENPNETELLLFSKEDLANITNQDWNSDYFDDVLNAIKK